MVKYPQRLIPALTAADFDLESIEELILSSKLPGAKALIAEKKGDVTNAARILLLQFEAALTADGAIQIDMLNQFLLFANRQSPQLSQEQRNKLFLPLFGLFKELTTDNMKTILPMALTGLIGKIPMEHCVQAAIGFFDSPACAGLTFGEMRTMLDGVLQLTLAELANVTQLVDVARGDRYKNQALLRKNRTKGQLGGLPLAQCGLSTIPLPPMTPRILTIIDGAEYSIDAMLKDPESDAAGTIVAQRHRRQFHESGAHFMLDVDEVRGDGGANLANLHAYVMGDTSVTEST